MKKSNSKLERKVSDKRAENIKKDSQVKELRKEIEIMKTKYDDVEAKSKTLEKEKEDWQNDVLIKRQKIVRLEHMLKNKTPAAPRNDE